MEKRGKPTTENANGASGETRKGSELDWRERIIGYTAVLTQPGGDRSYSSCSRAVLLNGYCVLGEKKKKKKLLRCWGKELEWDTHANRQAGQQKYCTRWPLGQSPLLPLKTCQIKVQILDILIMMLFKIQQKLMDFTCRKSKNVPSEAFLYLSGLICIM